MKVSVVIPAYNAERWLEECLESVKEQTFNPFNTVEAVVVNDGSTDQTRQIAKKILGYERFILNHQDNFGIGTARFNGVYMANHDYIAFLSADDKYHPYFLELMMRSADGKSILFSDYWRCDENLKPTSVVMAPHFKTQRQFRKLVVKWALNQNMFTNFSTVIIPKYVFNTVQFDENLRYGEDLVFLLETVLAKIPWKHVSLPLVYYRVHKDAGTNKGWNAKTRARLWGNLIPLLDKLGAPQKSIIDAYREAYAIQKRVLRKQKVPQPIINAYRKLRERVI